MTLGKTIEVTDHYKISTCISNLKKVFPVQTCIQIDISTCTIRSNAPLSCIIQNAFFFWIVSDWLTLHRLTANRSKAVTRLTNNGL